MGYKHNSYFHIFPVKRKSDVVLSTDDVWVVKVVELDVLLNDLHLSINQQPSIISTCVLCGAIKRNIYGMGVR